ERSVSVSDEDVATATALAGALKHIRLVEDGIKENDVPQKGAKTQH
ncbi:MAG: hypothetical protein JRF40_11830, partial [Deltaproteobacteria bacterium]|nr:hypothetical protein [Deltaproteobacteria bacterium]